MFLFQKINAAVIIFVLFCACNIVYAQESTLENPETAGETIDFVQVSFDKRMTSIKADFMSSESNISERINFIQTAFDKGQTRAKLWSYTWIAINGAGSGIQAYYAISSSHNRAFNIVGASESFLGLAVLFIDPFHARSSGSDLRKLPESTPEEMEYKLEKAEKWLERNYKQEKLGTSWLSHVGVLVISAVGAGIVWHYDGGKNGLISVLSSVAGGELFIWTQPTRGIKDYNDYRSKYKDAYNRIPERKYFVAPSKNGFVAGMYF
ncbi:MAG TPA: hypothetical protein VEM15_13095 [Thermodesulfobacteriota bacterium]|nr:hypothetical protein [Thermodesulfobacteriota bacterium]